ncbi:MAG: hypothetical protein GY757_08790 [bacterium]|nr:hypothetical protein [bacterium]
MKINMVLDGYKEQDYPFQCPVCYGNLTKKDIIGTGTYPIGGARSFMHLPGGEAYAFECSACFVKSVCHSDAVMLEYEV